VVVTKCFAAASVMGAGDVAELEHVSAGVLMGFLTILRDCRDVMDVQLVLGALGLQEWLMLRRLVLQQMQW